MLQPRDLVVNSLANNISNSVGTVGNISSKDLVAYPDHVESNVVFQNIEDPNDITRVIVFAGFVTEVVNPRTTRVYEVNIKCYLHYNLEGSVEKTTSPGSINTDVSIRLNNTLIDSSRVFSKILASEFYTYYYRYSQLIGFRTENSTIQAVLFLQKNPSTIEKNNKDIFRIEFYLVKPSAGSLTFEETTYIIQKNSEKIIEFTQLIGNMITYNFQEYILNLHFNRQFATSTDLNTQSLIVNIYIKDLMNSRLSVGVSTELFEDGLNKFYKVQFLASDPRKVFITGSFVIPTNRNWNSKPRNLTLDYQFFE